MTATGRIIKGIAGFYYVDTGSEPESASASAAGSFGSRQIYECRAKGNFRKQNLKPLIGDMVELDILDAAAHTGNIVRILPRSSELIRPAVANVDQVILVFAAAEPEPNRSLIDRFLVTMEEQEMRVLLCINKCDLSESEPDMQAAVRRLQHDYGTLAGYEVIAVSAKRRQGIGRLRELLYGKNTALAGPSGVGKSTLLNILVPDAGMQTGEISSKIKRGRHTTRHSEIFRLSYPEAGMDGARESCLIDTPGFSSVYLEGIQSEALERFFPEFLPYTESCRFIGCAHIREKDCGVLTALSNGLIAKERYDNYAAFYEERKNIRRY